MEFDFKQDIILEDDRVLLRPLQKSDLEHLMHFTESEPDLWKFSVSSIVGKTGMERYIDVALQAREKGNEYPFIIYDKQKRDYTGSTRFYDIQPAYGTMQLGYTWYGSEYQRTGLNRHCKLLLLSFAFDTLGAERVEFRADNENTKSIAAMKAIGCVVEGVLRSHIPRADGKRRDSIILSILRSEWQTGGKQMLQDKIKP